MTAGSQDQWTFRFRALRVLPRGGRLGIAHRWPSDWGTAQGGDPGAADYLDVRCNGASLRWWSARLHTWHPFDHILFIELLDDVPADAVVILRFGGEEGIGPGFHVQSFIEEASPFSLRWRAREGEPWTEIARHAIEVTGATPHRLVVVVPSRALPGEPVRVRVRIEDAWGNPAGLDRPETVLVEVPGQPEPRELQMPKEAFATLQMGALPPGTFRIVVRAPGLGLSGTSNALQCAADVAEPRVYWADLHAQSVIGCGARTIDAYYAHARDFAALDVCSHQANCFLVSEGEWRDTERSSRRNHAPGTFVTLLGYEWSAASALGGDHNVYFPGDEGELRRCSHEFVRDRSDADRDLLHVEDFYRHYRATSPLVAVHVGGRTANLKWHDATLDRLLEVHSTHATSEWFLLEALERGYRMGVIAGSDSVDGRPGNSHPGRLGVRNVRGGLTAILADNLTRESIWTALRRRRCYATTGERILLDVRLGSARMGDDVRLPRGNAHVDRLAVSVEGTAPIETIDFYRDGTRLARVDRFAGAPSRRLRVAWRGASAPGNWQRARMQWSGSLHVEGNVIARVEEYALDTPDEGVRHYDERSVHWHSLTAGDWDGVIVDLAHRDGELVFATEPLSVRVSLRDIGPAGRTIELASPERCLELRWLPEAMPAPGAEAEFADPSPPRGTHAYWVRVRQADGGFAWSTPIFVTCGEDAS